MVKKILRLAYIVIGIGLFMIILAAYIDLEYPKEAYDFGKAGNILLRSLLKDLGVGLTISGIVNFIIDKGGFSEDYAKRVTDVMIKDEYIDFLSREKLREMMFKLESKLLYNGIYNRDNYYYAVQNEMISLLNTYYYDECFIRIECFIKDDHILKKTYRRMIITRPKINGYHKSNVGIPFKTEMMTLSGYDEDSIFKINYLHVDTEDYTIVAKKSLSVSKCNEKNADKYCIKYEGAVLVPCNNTCIVEYETESISPLSDNFFSNRLTQPCKNYDIIFHLHDNNYYLEGESFYFMEHHRNKVVDYKCPQSLEIRFTDWMLPGNGVVFFINKK